MRIKCNVLIPLGVGLIISALLMNLSYSTLFKSRVEREARKLGMIYPYENKVLNTESEE